MPTLQDLIKAGIINPGRSSIAVSYKGTTYTASLEKDGAISYQGASCLLDDGLPDAQADPRNAAESGRGRRWKRCEPVSRAVLLCAQHEGRAKLQWGFVRREVVPVGDVLQHPLQAHADAQQAGRRRLEERAV